MRAQVQVQSRTVEQLGDVVIEFAAGFELPGAVRYTVENQGGYDAVYVIAIRDGRYECVDLQLRQRKGGSAITADSLREIAVRDVVRTALDLYYRQIVDSGRIKEADPVPLPRGVPASAIGDEALAQLAQVYQFATMFNEPPTKAVQDRYDVSRATAGRWVAEARRRGLLGGADA